MSDIVPAANWKAPTPSSSDPQFDAERERIHRQMLSSVSHDLKTPLASIIGSLEIFVRMKEKLTVQKQDELIKVALQEAHRLDSFVTNILDMAKLENGMVKAKAESVEIGATLRHCLGRVQPQLQPVNGHAEIEPVPGGLETMVDAVLLSRAVNLVLDNAIKHGGTPPALFLRYGRESEHNAFISVRDNGRGVPPDRTEVIFQKYARFAREDQQKAGPGLGLSIAREIMKLLGGTVTMATSPEGGALFTLHFPLR